MKNIFLLLLFTGAVNSCKKKMEEPTRGFYMGVTPWPGDFTQTEVDKAYSFINANSDIVSHHFDEGIPYEEAYNNSGWPEGLLNDINTRVTKTATSKKILLSSSALSLTRKTKAPYSTFSNAIDATIKSRWELLPVNDPKLVTAYTNYILYLANALQPTYINYGVESNNEQWTATEFMLYKDFLRQVYARLTTNLPNIPVMVSFMVNETAASLDFASQIIAFTDYIALSAYPYTHVSSSVAGNTNPALFPANYFTRYIELDVTKSFCFAETGYIADDLIVPSFTLNKQANAQWQNDYLQMICKLTNERKGKFIIWFCHKDYDAGNNTLRSLGLYQDLFALWEDIGLIDESNIKRPAYNTWLNWQQRKKR